MSVPKRLEFEIAPYWRRVEKPWGWELHWTPESAPYKGKLLHIRAGTRLSLQVHDAKHESWYLLSGRCTAVWEDASGVLIETELIAGRGYTCTPGRRHRLVGITDCELIEVSTPETGTTLRLADDFSRPHETPKQRAMDRGERQC
jgi:mannose-6-phosphate isomerase